MQIGYVRVSTNDQNTDLQRQALERAGCEQVFEEKMSGTVANRPALKKLLRTLSEGDTLVVWKLDRLGRSMRNLGHCCKVSDEAAFCLIQRPYISKTLLTRRISP
ncbi:recombinase family protein, partial [Enterobacter cloacae complex sp. SHL014]|uniref:recombinase family protein n=1 Tax=Enterobacter cloacae complex sp. SHL014 TaxID=3412396 RepID=UPI003B9F7F42